MDGEVPEYLAAGVSRDRDGSLRSLDDYYLTHELLELLHHADAGAGSSVPRGSLVDEKPSLNPLPSPSSPPLPTCYAAAAAESSARPVASEAEMASWLCQVFEQDQPSDPRTGTTTTTTKSEGESTVGISSGASGHSRGTSADERPGSSGSGRRRSCSGKAAEQRRRDKINDKMRTLQQLMPRCTKTDKASTLEHVIQYVKSLQHQLQMLSASGYAMPMPPAVVPPSCMHLAAGGALGGQAAAPAPVMLPPYPFVPAVFACPHHGHVAPPPPPQYQQQLAQPQRRHSKDLVVPSHSRTSHKE